MLWHTLLLRLRIPILLAVNSLYGEGENRQNSQILFIAMAYAAARKLITFLGSAVQQQRRNVAEFTGKP